MKIQKIRHFSRDPNLNTYKGSNSILKKRENFSRDFSAATLKFSGQFYDNKVNGATKSLQFDQNRLKDS